MKTYGEVVEFHGHSCPGLALGYGKVAEPKVRIKDERLLCIPCMEGKR